MAVLLLLAVTYGGSYFLYGRAVSFVHELPKYSDRIRGHARARPQADQRTGKNHAAGPASGERREEAHAGDGGKFRRSGLVTQNIGAVTEVVLTVFFIPFLVYFMLSWQEHARTKSVQLFSPENRSTAYVTLGHISAMMRSFIAGNFVIGLFMSICSVVVFGLLGIPYFYFIGFISGFLSLMPYLGIALAVLPPLAAGMGVLGDTGLIIVAGTVLGLHLLAMNVLYPKVLGSRLQLNPLVVTISLLIWGFIWGAMGLILAVPIMAAAKIICDNVTSLNRSGNGWGSEEHREIGSSGNREDESIHVKLSSDHPITGSLDLLLNASSAPILHRSSVSCICWCSADICSSVASAGTCIGLLA